MYSVFSRHTKDWFWLLLALYFATRLPWIFMVPMVEAPDEFSHFWVLRFLLEHWRLPEANEIIAGGPSGVYGSLPQLGYLPHVAAGLIGKLVAPQIDLSVTSRFGSLFSGTVLLWCAKEFGRRLFTKDTLLSLALPLLVIFHPQLVLVDSYANCDSVTASLAALALFMVCKMMENGLKTKSSLLLGGVLGWLVLTKYTGLAVYPACALGFGAAAWLNNIEIKRFFVQALITAATTAICSVWWFVRSASILGGDFMGTQTMFHTWAVTYHKSLQPDISAWAVIKDRRWWRFTIFSFWGMFGYMTIYLWRPIYWIYMGLMSVSLIGGIKGALQYRRVRLTEKESWENSAERDWLGRKETSERQKKFFQPALWLMLAICYLTNQAMMIFASTKNLGGAQGRYLFPSEIPILALLLGGLYLTGPKLGKPLILFAVAFNAIVYFESFRMLYAIDGFHQFLKTY